MGQSFKKLVNGGNGPNPGGENGQSEKTKRIQGIANRCYKNYSSVEGSHSMTRFHRAVCDAVQEINEELGGTQIRLPIIEELKKLFEEHHKSSETDLSREEFAKIIGEIAMRTSVMGRGAKDILLYIFGVPMATLFVKQGLLPKVISNEVFLPVVTSATVFILARQNRI